MLDCDIPTTQLTLMISMFCPFCVAYFGELTRKRLRIHDYLNNLYINDLISLVIILTTLYYSVYKRQPIKFSHKNVAKQPSKLYSGDYILLFFSILKSVMYATFFIFSLNEFYANRVENHNKCLPPPPTAGAYFTQFVCGCAS